MERFHRKLCVDLGDLHDTREFCHAEVGAFIVALKSVKADGAKEGRKVNAVMNRNKKEL